MFQLPLTSVIHLADGNNDVSWSPIHTVTSVKGEEGDLCKDIYIQLSNKKGKRNEYKAFFFCMHKKKEMMKIQNTFIE